MSRLSTTKRVQILNLLVEGMSLRAASRVADVSINTVYKLMADAGRACQAYHDATVRNVWAGQVQIDEMWAFCYAKEKRLARAVAAPAVAGDIWTRTALDRDSKMMVAWRVGDRTAETGYAFLRDLRRRLAALGPRSSLTATTCIRRPSGPCSARTSTSIISRRSTASRARPKGGLGRV